MGLFRASPQKKLVERGIDPARLPPGQYLTEKWPVLQASGVPRVDLGTWRFRTWGLVEEPLELDFEQLRELPATELVCDIHCVTHWSRFDMPWKGVSFRELVRRTRPSPDARYVVAHAEQGYTANLPFAVLDDDDTLVAYEADGEALTAEHGFPARLLVPKRYFWKSAKWIGGLEFRAD